MTNSELAAKLLTLDPNGPATVSIKADTKDTQAILPVLWIAKGSLYVKLPEMQAIVSAVK
jgi:hypothetical protein